MYRLDNAFGVLLDKVATFSLLLDMSNSAQRGKQWVVKDNRYIEAKFTNYRPTLAQNRVVLWLGSLVHSQQDDDFTLVECSVSQLRSVMGLNLTAEELIQELAILRSATAIMKQGAVWEAFGIIDTARLDEDTNRVQLRLSQQIKPFLLKIGEAGEGFTQIDLDKVQSMRSVHSQRIYELLLQYRNLGRGDSRLIKIQTLKEHLGLYSVKKGGKVDEKFPRWADFERRVLQQAEKDLCNAGMFVHYEGIKSGRKFDAIRFSFSIQRDLDGVILDGFKKLQLTGLTDYDKVRISNCWEKADIERAIIESDRTNSLAPLRALLPKSRKDYREKMSSIIKASMPSDDSSGDEEMKLF